MSDMLRNRGMYIESENKFGFQKFSLVWFLFSNGSYLKNDPRVLISREKCFLCLSIIPT